MYQHIYGNSPHILHKVPHLYLMTPYSYIAHSIISHARLYVHEQFVLSLTALHFNDHDTQRLFCYSNNALTIASLQSYVVKMKTYLIYTSFTFAQFHVLPNWLYNEAFSISKVHT